MGPTGSGVVGTPVQCGCTSLHPPRTHAADTRLMLSLSLSSSLTSYSSLTHSLQSTQPRDREILERERERWREFVCGENCGHFVPLEKVFVLVGESLI